jgi:hypothetical protein
MTYRKTLRIAMLGLGVSLLTSQAHAVAITDVNIDTSGGAFVNPSAAYLGQGNAKKIAINELTGLFAGDPWALLDTTKKPSNPFNNTNFVISADRHKKSGEWGVAWGEADLTQTMDFILVLKGGKQWGAYLFESGSDLSDTGSIDGLFQMSMLNKKGKAPRLHRALIFGRVAANDGSSTGTGGSSSGSDGSSSGGSEGGSPGGSEGGSSGGSESGSWGGSEGGSSGGSEGDSWSGSEGGSSGGSEGGSWSGSEGGSDGGSSGSDEGTLGSGGAPTDQVTDVPAPGSLALLLLGLGLVGLRQLSRNRPELGDI